MAYTGFRSELGPAQYPRDKTAAGADYVVCCIVGAFTIVYIAFLAILIGVRGLRQRLSFFIRLTVTTFIGISIVVSNVGQSWEIAWLTDTPMAYKVGKGGEIHADLGVYIGLRSVNVTLKGVPEQPQTGAGVGEKINYNERYYFDGQQGRIGFGRYSAQVNREFRKAQLRGTPLPILWVLEYFTLDGEDIRWGRNYRLSGWYANMALWTSFPLWILANVLFFMYLQSACEMLLLCGICMLSSILTWSTLRYGDPLFIPIAPGKVLLFSYGWSFYLCLLGGITALSSAVGIIVFQFFFPFETIQFFNLNLPLDDNVNGDEYEKRWAHNGGHKSPDVKNVFSANIDEIPSETIESIIEEIESNSDPNVMEMCIPGQPLPNPRRMAERYRRKSFKDVSKVITPWLEVNSNKKEEMLNQPITKEQKSE